MHGRLPKRLLVLFATVLGVGCAEDFGEELAIRECLWVLSATRSGERFAGREVPVCGSVRRGVGGALYLADERKPQDLLRLHLPPAPNGDPGVARVLRALERQGGDAARSVVEGRFHGRIEPHPDGNVLHVRRVDGLDGRPR